jgi:hypothetical protein
MKWEKIEAGWYADPTREWEVLSWSNAGGWGAATSQRNKTGWYWCHKAFLLEKKGPFGTRRAAIADLNKQMEEWGAK